MHIIRWGVIGFLNKFEHMIVYSLIVMMILTVSLTTIELGWIIIRDIITPPVIPLEIATLIFAIAMAVYATQRFLTADRKLHSERPR